MAEMSFAGSLEGRSKRMLEIKGLSKKYFGETVLEDINLVVEPGEIVGLFGENGAGKTTLLKCIP